MDEVYEYCVRMLGAGAVAIHAAHEAFVKGGSDRIDRLAGAVQACRTREMDGRVGAEAVAAGGSGTLADSVAREVGKATAKLPADQREALALRDLVGLDHEQIAEVLDVDRDVAATQVARARLALRANRRGVEEEPHDACTERARALVVMVRRQDGERVSGEAEDWLVDHLGSCESCSRVHAAMLEASVCYRAWRIPDPVAARPDSDDDAAEANKGDGHHQDAVGDTVP
jgi:hypothetical protein